MAQELQNHQNRVNENPLHVSTAALNVGINHHLAPEYYKTWAKRNAEQAKVNEDAYNLANANVEAGIDPAQNLLLADQHSQAKTSNQLHAANNLGRAVQAVQFRQAMRAGAQGPQAGALGGNAGG
jgi:acylphosphatase